MADITPGMIKELRDKTGLGLKKCKEALVDAAGDIEKAVVALRKSGLAAAEKRMGRSASEGMIFSYIHGNGKLGVMLELNCETDFVAKTDDFQNLGKDLCMHIAAMAPEWVGPEDVDPAYIEKEKEIAQEQMKDKPENVVEKIIEGKVKKILSENCLLMQGFVKDDKQTVENLVKSMIAKLGENIKVGKFSRIQLGEE
jgi:elongation factor Ts